MPTGDQIVGPPIIPKRESWLYKNKKAHNSVKRGLRQTTRGKYRGSFAKHVKK